MKKKISLNGLTCFSLAMVAALFINFSSPAASTAYKDFVNSSHMTGMPTNQTVVRTWTQEFIEETIIDATGRPSNFTVRQFNSWLTVHCPAPTTIICLAVEEYIDGNLHNVIPTIYNGTFQ